MYACIIARQCDFLSVKAKISTGIINQQYFFFRGEMVHEDHTLDTILSIAQYFLS